MLHANKDLSYNLRSFFGLRSILSKQVEHSKCPFLLQKDFFDLSISFLQIKHLKIGDIKFNQLINLL